VDQLHLALAPSDLAVVVQALPAWRAGDNRVLEELDAWVLRTRETSELRLQTEQMGRSLGDWQAGLASRDRSGPQERAWCYPVAFARAAASCEATPRQAGLAFAFGWAENMGQAAVKAVPLGQSAGQRILARLASEIPQAVDHALQVGDRRQAFSPMLAILSARHETQYSRLFRS
jgi:urease accessory protein